MIDCIASHMVGVVRPYFSMFQTKDEGKDIEPIKIAKWALLFIKSLSEPKCNSTSCEKRIVPLIQKKMKQSPNSGGVVISLHKGFGGLGESKIFLDRRVLLQYSNLVSQLPPHQLAVIENKFNSLVAGTTLLPAGASNSVQNRPTVGHVETSSNLASKSPMDLWSLLSTVPRGLGGLQKENLIAGHALSIGEEGQKAAAATAAAMRATAAATAAAVGAAVGAAAVGAAAPPHTIVAARAAQPAAVVAPPPPPRPPSSPVFHTLQGKVTASELAARAEEEVATAGEVTPPPTVTEAARAVTPPAAAGIAGVVTPPPTPPSTTPPSTTPPSISSRICSAITFPIQARR